jgi:hypothetical protein
MSEYSIAEGLSGADSGSSDSFDFNAAVAAQVAPETETDTPSTSTPHRTAEDQVRGALDPAQLAKDLLEPDASTHGFPLEFIPREPKAPEPRIVGPDEFIISETQRAEVERELEQRVAEGIELSMHRIAASETDEQALAALSDLRSRLTPDAFEREVHQLVASVLENEYGYADGQLLADRVEHLRYRLQEHSAVESFRRAEEQAAEARRLADEKRPGQMQDELKSWATERGYSKKEANRRLELLSAALPDLENLPIEAIGPALRAADDAAMQLSNSSPQQVRQRQLEAIYDSVLNTDLGTVDDGLQVLTPDGRLLSPVREHARAVARQAAAEQAAKMPRAPQPRRRRVETADEIREGVGLAAIDDETFLSDGLRYSDGTPVTAADLERLTVDLSTQKTQPMPPGVFTIGAGGR